MFSSLWPDEWAAYLVGSEGPARIDTLAKSFIFQTKASATGSPNT